MPAYDWMPTAVNVAIAIIMALSGIAFHSTVKSLVAQSRIAVSAMKAEYEESIRNSEDNVVAFLRKHEQDPYAHPNSIALQEIKAGIGTLVHEIRTLREALILAKLISPQLFKDSSMES